MSEQIITPEESSPTGVTTPPMDPAAPASPRSDGSTVRGAHTSPYPAPPVPPNAPEGPRFPGPPPTYGPPPAYPPGVYANGNYPPPGPSYWPGYPPQQMIWPYMQPYQPYPIMSPPMMQSPPQIPVQQAYPTQHESPQSSVPAPPATNGDNVPHTPPQQCSSHVELLEARVRTLEAELTQAREQQRQHTNGAATTGATSQAPGHITQASAVFHPPGHSTMAPPRPQPRPATVGHDAVLIDLGASADRDHIELLDPQPSSSRHKGKSPAGTVSSSATTQDDNLVTPSFATRIRGGRPHKRPHINSTTPPDTRPHTSNGRVQQDSLDPSTESTDNVQNLLKFISKMPAPKLGFRLLRGIDGFPATHDEKLQCLFRSVTDADFDEIRSFFNEYKELPRDAYYEQATESIFRSILVTYHADDINLLQVSTPEQSDRHLTNMFRDFRRNPNKATTVRYLQTIQKGLKQSRAPHSALCEAATRLLPLEAVRYYKDTFPDHQWSNIIWTSDPDEFGASHFAMEAITHLTDSLLLIIEDFRKDDSIRDGDWGELPETTRACHARLYTAGAKTATPARASARVAATTTPQAGKPTPPVRAHETRPREGAKVFPQSLDTPCVFCGDTTHNLDNCTDQECIKLKESKLLNRFQRFTRFAYSSTKALAPLQSDTPFKTSQFFAAWKRRDWKHPALQNREWDYRGYQPAPEAVIALVQAEEATDEFSEHDYHPDDEYYDDEYQHPMLLHQERYGDPVFDDDIVPIPDNVIYSLRDTTAAGALSTSPSSDSVVSASMSSTVSATTTVRSHVSITSAMNSLPQAPDYAQHESLSHSSNRAALLRDSVAPHFISYLDRLVRSEPTEAVDVDDLEGLVGHLFNPHTTLAAKVALFNHARDLQHAAAQVGHNMSQENLDTMVQMSDFLVQASIDEEGDPDGESPLEVIAGARTRLATGALKKKPLPSELLPKSVLVPKSRLPKSKKAPPTKPFPGDAKLPTSLKAKRPRSSDTVSATMGPTKQARFVSPSASASLVDTIHDAGTEVPRSLDSVVSQIPKVTTRLRQTKARPAKDTLPITKLGMKNALDPSTLDNLFEKLLKSAKADPLSVYELFQISPSLLKYVHDHFRQKRWVLQGPRVDKQSKDMTDEQLNTLIYFALETIPQIPYQIDNGTFDRLASIFSLVGIELVDDKIARPTGNLYWDTVVFGRNTAVTALFDLGCTLNVVSPSFAKRLVDEGVIDDSNIINMTSDVKATLPNGSVVQALASFVAPVSLLGLQSLATFHIIKVDFKCMIGTPLITAMDIHFDNKNRCLGAVMAPEQPGKYHFSIGYQCPWRSSANLTTSLKQPPPDKGLNRKQRKKARRLASQERQSPKPVNPLETLQIRQILEQPAVNAIPATSSPDSVGQASPEISADDSASQVPRSVASPPMAASRRMWTEQYSMNAVARVYLEETSDLVDDLVSLSVESVDCHNGMCECFSCVVDNKSLLSDYGIDTLELGHPVRADAIADAAEYSATHLVRLHKLVSLMNPDERYRNYSVFRIVNKVLEDRQKGDLTPQEANTLASALWSILAPTSPPIDDSDAMCLDGGDGSALAPFSAFAAHGRISFMVSFEESPDEVDITEVPTVAALRRLLDEEETLASAQSPPVDSRFSLTPTARHDVEEGDVLSSAPSPVVDHPDDDNSSTIAVSSVCHDAVTDSGPEKVTLSEEEATQTASQDVHDPNTFNDETDQDRIDFIELLRSTESSDTWAEAYMSSDFSYRSSFLRSEDLQTLFTLRASDEAGKYGQVIVVDVDVSTPACPNLRLCVPVSPHMLSEEQLGEIKTLFTDRLDGVCISPEDSLQSVCAMFKPKAKRCLPIPELQPDGLFPKGDGGPPRFVPRRLTPEESLEMDQHIAEHLRPAESSCWRRWIQDIEGVFAFNSDQEGRLSPHIDEPTRIHVKPGGVINAKQFHVYGAIAAAAREIILKGVSNGQFEPCSSPHKNGWFLVQKKSGDYRFILDCQGLNQITLKDAFHPPSAELLAERFAGNEILSLLDIKNGYGQKEIAVQDRDYTAFVTDFGSYRCTTLPQGWCNSPAAFHRAMLNVLKDIDPSKAVVFLDDVAVAGPKTDYGGAEDPRYPGCRRYVMEHMENLIEVLTAIYHAGLTISFSKAQLFVSEAEFLGFISCKDGRFPSKAKVERINQIPFPQTVKKLRSFLGAVVYFRAWIPYFGGTAAPLYDLIAEATKRESKWIKQTPAAVAAFTALKEALTSHTVLHQFDPALPIVLTTDASSIGWGAVMSHIVSRDGASTRRPVRFESGLWGPTERAYASTHMECLAVKRALEKLRYHLTGVRFLIESDNQALTFLLKDASIQMPNNLLIRWMTYIKLFDFDVKFIYGRDNPVADWLSRSAPVDHRPAPKQVQQDLLLDLVPDDYRQNAQPVNVICVLQAPPSGFLEYKGHSLGLVIEVLVSNAVPASESLQRVCGEFFVGDGYLWKVCKDGQHKRVMVTELEVQELLKELHGNFGHRGVAAMMGILRQRYFWPGMEAYVKSHKQSCVHCALADPRKAVRPPLKLRLPHAIWTIVQLDILELPATHEPSKAVPVKTGMKPMDMAAAVAVTSAALPTGGDELVTGVVNKDGHLIVALPPYQYVIVCRDTFSGWIEAAPLRTKSSRAVAVFFHDFVLARFGVPVTVYTDQGHEFEGDFHRLCEDFNINQRFSAAHHGQSTGIVERGHQNLLYCLRKYGTEWIRFLHTALWADRCMVKKTTGKSPFELMFGVSGVLPVDSRFVTWNYLSKTIPETVNADDALFQRSLQLATSVFETPDVRDRIAHAREQAKRYYDEAHRTFLFKPIKLNDFVFLRDLEPTNKLAPRWMGPFKVVEVFPDTNTCRLADVNNEISAKRVTFDRLKLFEPATILDFEFTKKQLPNAPSRRTRGEPATTAPTRAQLERFVSN